MQGMQGLMYRQMNQELCRQAEAVQGRNAVAEDLARLVLALHNTVRALQPAQALHPGYGLDRARDIRVHRQC